MAGRRARRTRAERPLSTRLRQPGDALATRPGRRQKRSARPVNRKRPAYVSCLIRGRRGADERGWKLIRGQAGQLAPGLGEELSSPARPAPLTHCVPPRGGTRCVKEALHKAADAPTSRDHRLRQTTLERAVPHSPPTANDALRLARSGRLSLKSKWRLALAPTRREMTNHEAPGRAAAR